MLQNKVNKQVQEVQLRIIEAKSKVTRVAYICSYTSGYLIPEFMTWIKYPLVYLRV